MGECAEADRLIREGEAAAEAERKAKEEIAHKPAPAIGNAKEDKTSDEQSDVNEEERLSAAVEARMKEEEKEKKGSALPPEKPGGAVKSGPPDNHAGVVKRKGGSENSSSRTSPTTVSASPREEKRSPGDPVARSRRSDEGSKSEEKTRKLSGKADQERKVVDQEKVRRESGKKTSGGAWDVGEKVAVQKPKPVLTEEMEREIIFGSFKKEKKVEKKEEPSKKVDKKESREEKLQSVRKEIESRFREEEEKMRKEREKQRKHEEKLQKEREKLLKDRREEQKRQKVDDELLVKEAAEDTEQDEAMDTTESVPELEEEPAKRPAFINPYERIKEEILKMEKEKAEMDRKRQLEKEAEEREE